MAIHSSVLRRITDSELYDQLVFRKRVLLESDESYVRKRFREKLGYEPNLEHPETYCEKVTWLLLYYRPLELAPLSDKYAVRSHVRDVIGAEYLNELYGVYRSVSEIPWDALPAAFVLKATHGCRWNILCPDKTKQDRRTVMNILRRWLRTNYYWLGREWVYRSLVPRVVCERYLTDDGGPGLTDYKVHCFDGVARLVQVDVARQGEHQMGFLTPEWELLRVGKAVPRLKEMPRLPERLHEMLDLSERLSRGQPLVRVDWYQSAGQLIFGEMTFLPGRGLSAFSNPAFEKTAGNWIQLPEPKLRYESWARFKAALWFL